MKTTRRTWLSSLLVIFVGARHVGSSVVIPDKDDVWLIPASKKSYAFMFRQTRSISGEWGPEPIFPDGWRATFHPEENGTRLVTALNHKFDLNHAS